MKPKFYKPDSSTLIRFTTPMEQVNIDFKGPLPSPVERWESVLPDVLHSIRSLLSTAMNTHLK